MFLRRWSAPLILLLTVIAFAYLGSSVPDKGADDPFAGGGGDAERGAYVARMGGCHACHTDAARGGAEMAGGVAIATPFGIFVGPNITPHATAGIGTWTYPDFARAMRQGRRARGGHYYPAFPYAAYSLVGDRDLVDLWAYLGTIAPVAMPAPGHDLNFPFNLRPLLGLWKWLFFAPRVFEADPGRSKEWNRGAYVVLGLGHCAECHTPRTAFGSLDRTRPFAGLEGGTPLGKVPDIRPAALKGRGWTAEDLAFALRAGLKQDGDSFSGAMAEVVRHGTSHLTQEDLLAIAVHLLDGR